MGRALTNYICSGDSDYEVETDNPSSIPTPVEGLEARFDWLYDLDIFPFETDEEADYADRRLSWLLDEEMGNVQSTGSSSLQTVISRAQRWDVNDGAYITIINGKTTVHGRADGSHNITIANQVVVDHIVQTLYTFVSSQVRHRQPRASNTFVLTDEALTNFVTGGEFDEAPLEALHALSVAIRNSIKGQNKERVRDLLTIATWNYGSNPRWELYCAARGTNTLLDSYN